ncbi:hypothetical protein RA241_003672 [Cronobacter sakazakii]|nr:hypothetical protein [Cronobacter sakazakii]
MSTLRRMPALSPEEIRKISEKAVATVAAQKIVTNKTAYVNGTLAGKVLSKSTQSTKNSDTKNATWTRLARDTMKAHSSGAGLKNRVSKMLASSVLSQSEGRQYLQESFNKVRKTLKA